mmetsp:Transcript_37757/g.94741  ORF Transcript_37757/g.94741 Transcript_37757/m.94741 type:complete len:212 (+) Transcript_37757:587-1222(+)
MAPSGIGFTSFFGGGATYFGAAFGFSSPGAPPGAPPGSADVDSSWTTSGPFTPAFSSAAMISFFSTHLLMSVLLVLAKALSSPTDKEDRGLYSFSRTTGVPSMLVRLCFLSSFVAWFSSSHFAHKKALQFVQKTAAKSAGSFSQASHFLSTFFFSGGGMNFGFFFGGSLASPPPVSAAPDSSASSLALAASAIAITAAMDISSLPSAPCAL